MTKERRDKGLNVPLIKLWLARFVVFTTALAFGVFLGLVLLSAGISPAIASSIVLVPLWSVLFLWAIVHLTGRK